MLLCADMWTDDWMGPLPYPVIYHWSEYMLAYAKTNGCAAGGVSDIGAHAVVTQAVTTVQVYALVCEMDYATKCRKP